MNYYAEPKDDIERVILDLEKAATSKSENMKIDTLQKCFAILVKMDEGEYMEDPAKNLVEEEIKKEKILFK